MNGNSALKLELGKEEEKEKCEELLISDIRALLLLSLKYITGENVDLIIARKYLRQALDKLSQLEEKRE